MIATVEGVVVEYSSICSSMVIVVFFLRSYFTLFAIKELKFFSHLSHFKNNGPVLLFKTIFKHWNCLLSTVSTDGKDGHGLRLQKGGPTFSSCIAMPEKIVKTKHCG